MSERNAVLAEAIADGLEHIAKGLRKWAEAQRQSIDRPNVQNQGVQDGGDRLLRVKEAAEILGVSTSTIYKFINEGALKRNEPTGRIARSELDRFIRGSG